MGIPTGAHGTDTYNTRGGSGSKQNKKAISNAKASATSYNRNRGNDQAYLAQLREMLMGGGYPDGPGVPNDRGRNNGNSGYNAYAAAEAQRRRELEQRKAALIAQLQGARQSAIPLLDQYKTQYDQQIGNVFNQNRGLNQGYSDQLAAVQNQMNAGAQSNQAMLQRDLQGQGAGAGDLRAMSAAAGQQMAGTNLLAQLGQMYNTRLAQVMAQRQADAQAMGEATRASSLGNLENSYASLLGQIGMMGLV